MNNQTYKLKYLNCPTELKEMYKNSDVSYTLLNNNKEILMSCSEMNNKLIKISYDCNETESEREANYSIVEIVNLVKDESLKKITHIQACSDERVVIAFESKQIFIYQNTENFTNFKNAKLLYKEQSEILGLNYNEEIDVLLVSSKTSSNVKLLKLKSESLEIYNTKHEDTSIKSVALSNKLLVTSGCDGSLNVAKFNDEMKLEHIYSVNNFFNKNANIDDKTILNSISINNSSTICCGGKKLLRKSLEIQDNVDYTNNTSFWPTLSLSNSNLSEITCVEFSSDPSMIIEILTDPKLGNYYVNLRNINTLEILGKFKYNIDIFCPIIKTLYDLKHDQLIIILKNKEILTSGEIGNIHLAPTIEEVVENKKEENYDEMIDDIIQEIDNHEDFLDELNGVKKEKKDKSADRKVLKKNKKSLPKNEELSDLVDLTENDEDDKKVNVNVNKEANKKKSRKINTAGESNTLALLDQYAEDDDDSSFNGEEDEEDDQTDNDMNSNDTESKKLEENQINRDPNSKLKIKRKKKKKKQTVSELESIPEDLTEGAGSISDGITHTDEVSEAPKIISAESKLEKIFDLMPQPPFILNSTSYPTEGNNTNSRFLCFNTIGKITITEEANYKHIFCEFSDHTNKRYINFTDKRNITLAALNNCGLVLAIKPDAENIDEYEKENKVSNSTLIFKSNNSLTDNKDWEIDIPYESIENLTLGVNWIAVYTDLFNVYIYSMSGILSMVFTVPHQVTCMSGYENLLTYVYHPSAPMFGSQNFLFKIIDISNNFNVYYEGPLSLTYNSSLEWFGFSDEGMLFSFDSDKILRHFSYNLGKNWIPMMNLSREYINNNFWIVGIQDFEIVGVEIKNGGIEPTPFPKPFLKHHKIKCVFDTNSLLFSQNQSEDIKISNLYNTNGVELITNKVMIEHEKWRTVHYDKFKKYRSADSGEYYYTGTVKTDDEVFQMKKANDIKIIELFKDVILENKIDQAIDLIDYIQIPSNMDIVLALTDRIRGEFKDLVANKISEKKELRTSNLGDVNMNMMNMNLNNSQHSNNNKVYTNGYHKKEENLFNHAININRIREEQTEEIRDDVSVKIKNNIFNSDDHIDKSSIQEDIEDNDDHKSYQFEENKIEEPKLIKVSLILLE